MVERAPRLVRTTLRDGGLLELYDPWLGRDEAERTLAALRDEVAWKQETIFLFGKEVIQPRLTAWYGDPSSVYTYSGRTFEPLPWTPTLTLLRDRVAETTGFVFDSVLCNFYRSGRVSMGFHADDEPELGENPIIA